MNNFTDTVDYSLKVPQINQDMKTTLKSIHKISMQYNEQDENLKQFFKSTQPKINYLFWLYQNEENKYLEEHLSEIFEQYDDMKQKYKLAKKNRYTSSIALENSVSNFDTECLL